jgi:CO/xanthine dehydrogenase Mo-binding subunit/aerobic-type carbon monoxide dehydrogenase small subunit (CoxS/CutS family)
MNLAAPGGLGGRAASGGGVTFALNGAAVTVASDPCRRLSDVLRDDLGLTGTKVGCDAGDCGACTVHLDGQAVCACLTPLWRVEGRAVGTVEGLAPQGGAEGLRAAFLRHGAAQCGICSPGMLMAASALLARNARPSRGEVEAAISGVLCRCTGYRKIVDAICDAGGMGTGPVPDAGQAVGAGIARLDGAPKLDGTESYGADHHVAGALLVRAVRSPHAAARFTLGDFAGWATARGVRVFTAADIGGVNRFSVIPAFADQPALAEGEVRFRGEAVALVAGGAEVVGALDLGDFPVAWVPLVAVTDPGTAGNARAVLPGRADNILTRGRVVRGDAVAALAASAVVAEVEVQTACVEHAYIEPEAGIAWMEGDTLVIRACTQAPMMDRDDTARVLGLPPDRVRIIPSAVGGGFGSKLDLSVQPLIGLVALKTGRPARMVFSRAESMQATTKRHPARISLRVGADAAGKVTGMVFDGLFDTGPYSSWGPTVANRVPVHASGPYFTPAYRAEAQAVHTNNPVAGAFRGFGVPQAAVAQEMVYDDLARQLGMDRLAFRRANVLRDGQATVTGQVLAGVGIGACLGALAPHWDRALAEAAALNAGGGPLRRGVGVASCWYGCGNTGLPNPSTVRAGITRDGRVVLHQGATDIGQGSDTVIVQIFADALGVPVRAVERVGADTALTPDCGKTSASRQTYVTGRAALAAGRALRAEILRRTNKGDGAEIAVAPGEVRVTDAAGAATIVLSGLPEGPQGYVLMAEETYDPPTTPLDANGQGAAYAVYGWGAQIAEVAVDMALGTVRVVKITAAHDVGRAINPVLAEGQVQGGIAQGLGMALMEDYVAGRTENLHDYLIPTVGDMPEVETILVEVPDPEGPLGAKGLGEHALIPTAPAILNAIRDATGVWVTRLPALPHRVLAAIRGAT